MAETPDSPDKYTVDRLPGVTEQIRRFVTKAKRLGIGAEVLDALESIVTKLETMPLEWSDPEYATRKAGGLVHHGLHFPFVVHYAIFQPERVVCIIEIRVYPRHPLEGDVEEVT